MMAKVLGFAKAIATCWRIVELQIRLYLRKRQTSSAASWAYHRAHEEGVPSTPLNKSWRSMSLSSNRMLYVTGS